MVCKCLIKLRVATLIDFKLRDREYLMLPRPLSLSLSPDTSTMPSSTSSPWWWREEGEGRCWSSYVRLVRWSPWASPVHCWTLKPNILHYKTIFWPHSTKIYREPTWFLGLNFTWLILPPVLVNYQETRSLSSLQSSTITKNHTKPYNSLDIFTQNARGLWSPLAGCDWFRFVSLHLRREKIGCSQQIVCEYFSSNLLRRLRVLQDYNIRFTTVLRVFLGVIKIELH